MRACLTLSRSKSEIIQVPTRHIPFMLSLSLLFSLGRFQYYRGTRASRRVALDPEGSERACVTGDVTGASAPSEPEGCSPLPRALLVVTFGLLPGVRIPAVTPPRATAAAWRGSELRKAIRRASR